MAAVLVGGENYSLYSSSNQRNKKKTIVYVKLTDSSLRALEEYLSSSSSSASKGNSNSQSHHFKPTIEFNQNSGKICIPRNSNGDKSTYRFNVSSINESHGPQGSFECLQSHKPSSTLESIGSLQEKITVNASDDAYTRFGQKMVEVKKENEKRTTQFLDNNKVSNKISSKLRHNKNSSSSIHTSSSSLSTNTSSNISSSISLSRHLNNNSSSSSSRDSLGGSSSSSSLNHHSNIHHHHHRIVPSSSASNRSSPSTNSSSSLAPNHPIMDRKQQAAANAGGFTKSVNPPGHPNISRRPLRERVIHHLAVGPLKKLELNSRLHRDGLRDKDKKLINQVIKQVSMMKDNTYSLLRHLWNDVSEDWPYYTEQEKATFRRRKPQNLTPPVSDGCSSTCSSGHSPSSTNPASPARCDHRSPPHHHSASSKRSFPYEGELVSKKKQRVSNYQRPPPNGGLPPTQQQQQTQYPRQPSVPAAKPQQHQVPSIRKPHRQTPPPAMAVEDPSTKTSNWLNSRPSSQGPVVSAKQPSSSSSGGSVSSSTQQQQRASPYFSPRDFLSAFTKIKDKAQRASYKVEFNKDYIRYRELHSQLEKVSKRFAQSEEQLRSIIQTEEKVEARKKIKEIEHDYRNTNSDPAYVRTREEFKYLHEKLAHIKNLVHDYDMDNLSKGKGPSSSGAINAGRGTAKPAPGTATAGNNVSPVLSAMS